MFIQLFKLLHGKWVLLFSFRTGPETGEQVLQILKSVSFEIEEMRKQESELKPPDGDFISLLSSREIFCVKHN